MGIWVRIGPQNSLAVRKRRTNGVSPAASVQSGQLLSPATYVDTGGYLYVDDRVRMSLKILKKS